MTSEHPVTYDKAAQMPLSDVLNRYQALNDRDTMARAIAMLQARGEWNADRTPGRHLGGRSP